MNDMNQILAQMNFDFFGSGKHGMSIDGMRKALGNKDFFFLDVRSDKEAQYLAFPFACHIPLNELPERLTEVPKDKTVITFCSAVFRGAMAYLYLKANGYESVKGLTASSEDMVGAFKPGPLAKM